MAEHQFKFSKQERLCSETRITELFQNGESFMSYPVRVVFLASKAVEKPRIQVLMSVPKKKLKHAVDRNRVKRLLREAYRLNKHPLWAQVVESGFSLEIAFIWIPSEVLDYAKVEKKMKDAVEKFGKLLSDKTDASEKTVDSEKELI